MDSLEKTAKALIPRVARQRSLEQPLDISRRIYRLADGWEGAVLKEEASILHVRSLEELRKALEDPAALTLLIVKEAALDVEAVAALIDRSGLKKTVFLE